MKTLIEGVANYLIVSTLLLLNYLIDSRQLGSTT
jgi:hypothetical protein